jgi:AcrR family transcriptional regulator
VGVAERKEREKELRRQQILKAGSNLFIKQGVKSTTMEQIAQAVEISRGTIYLYFQNKEELLFTLIRDSIVIFINILNENIKPEDNTDIQLASIGKSYLYFYENDPTYFKFLNYMESEEDLSQITDLAKQCYQKSEELWGIIVKVIIEGIEKGLIKKDTNPYELAILLWSSSYGVIQIMDHIKYVHKNELPIGLENSTDSINKHDFSNINYKDILTKLWSFISIGIRNK